MAKGNMREGNPEHISNLRDRLMQVANEIDTIKNSFSKSTEDLSRIQNMLDVGGLEEISGIIENFESKLSEAEKEREEATQGARRYGEELEKEKERLVKLWDAYKNQEEELSTTEKKLAEYEDRARMAEASKEQLEQDLNARIETLNKKLQENEEKVNQFDSYKQRYEEFDGIRNTLEEEINSLKDGIKNRDVTIDSMQKQVEGLKEYEKYAEYKDQFEELTGKYEKEKERLTKLYHLYEETEAECNHLREQMTGWQSWYDSNKDIFNRLFSAAPPVGKTPAPPKSEKISEPPSPEIEVQPEETVETETKNNKKKKGLFRK
jgi:chromosome segregation ATPase